MFVSGEPHALLEVINKYQLNELHNTAISFVIGNKENVASLVQRHEIPFYFIDTKLQSVKEYEKQQLEIVRQHN